MTPRQVAIPPQIEIRSLYSPFKEILGWFEGFLMDYSHEEVCREPFVQDSGYG
jgi:hypothetical protein